MGSGINSIFGIISKCFVFSVSRGRELLIADAPIKRSANSIRLFCFLRSVYIFTASLIQ